MWYPRRLALLVVSLLLASGLAVLVAAQPAVAAPCDPPVTNPVACENTLPGSPESEWGVTGAGSASIQGFATDMSVDQGQTVGFKVDTTASSYRLDVYRMGYYGGDGARRVATVSPTSVRDQPACLTNSTTGLVDCGNWTTSASWAVPADAVSGIYFARLVRTDGTAGASHAFFVVRDDDGGSDLLFQTSDTTWQAYNAYGGNSLYTGNPVGRAYKVSYNRPFTTRANAPEDFVFNAEYPMVRFLESNGYDVSYFSGVDTDRRGAELLEHDAFLSVGHDEYWSGTQRANVEAARAAGVHLAFFSGNEVFWKTRWENSIDGSGTSHRTLVSYKETHANAKIDPAPEWTGTWRDPRFSPPADGGRPENALTGQMFMINCCAVDMVVGQGDGQMRFWRNTRVATLAAGATTTVGDDVIGYEWDEDLDNGHRPPGAFRLSQTTASGEKLQDHGSTYAQGQGTHSMTLYRHASGALVFGAGTIQWPWALDAEHDRGSSPADVAAQQATVNLLADMGVQPDTLRTGLTAATASTDTTAPTATITSPAQGAAVPAGSPLTVSGTAADTGGRVGGVEVSTDDGRTWRRATGRTSWSYTFTPGDGSLALRVRAVDDSGNLAAASPATTVTVGDGPVTCPCSIWPSTATPDRTDPDRDPVEVGVKFRASTDGFVDGIRFYKPVESTGTHVGSLWTRTGTRLAQVTFTNETASGWQQATFANPVPVTAGTTYVASYFTPSRYAVSSRYFQSAPTTRGPLTALADGTDGGNGVYRYTTTPGTFPDQTWQSENYWVDVVFTDAAPAPDTTKPTLTARTPAPGATAVPLGVSPTATFSEPVQPDSITFTLTGPDDTPVAAATTYEATTRTTTLDPAADLSPTTTYTATLTGARDTAGNQIDPVTWTFTTDTPDTTPPTVTGRYPAPGVTNVPTSANPTATFGEPVQSGSIVFELTGPGTTPVPGATTYDATSRTATLDPDGGLAASTTYTATVSGARDAAGNQMEPTTWTFTTGASTLNCPCTIWPTTATPARTDADPSSVELGVKFRSSTDGYITGIRYYKPVESTGTHVGSLWTRTGTRLAQVTFTEESASGWQQATFANPVPVTAGTTYVASYFTPSRYVADSAYFATSGFTREPLTALQNGTDGGNGVYRYTGTASTFPDQTYQGENYWVDVVFEESAVDTTRPTVTSRTPAPDAVGVPVSVHPTATLSEPVVGSSVTMELRDAQGQVVPSTTAWNAGSLTATLTPSVALEYSSSYTVGVSGARDAAGNTMEPVSWGFQTAAPPPPGPEVGPGGPIAVVTSNANPSSTYLAEILRAEGLNEFSTVRASALDATGLAAYSVVVLGDVSLTDAQVAALTDWVGAGGNLIAMRPDPRLHALAGITAQTGTVADGYLAVDATSEPGAGITTETMQFHGTASRYSLAGAGAVATLYSTASASTGLPAVTLRSVGSNGGQVATFAYDLARSVIATRQGNPAWAGQDRDGMTPNRSNDLYFGGSATDWVDLAKVHVPQADEQQRLLANLVTVTARDRLPVPRFWYFPGGHKAVVVATGDDHGNGGTNGRFSTYAAASPEGCSVSRWECPRFSSYVFPGTPITDSAARTYAEQGFEVGLHPQNGCTNYSSYDALAGTYSAQLDSWRGQFPSLASPTTSRYHCIVWNDWASQPKAQLAAGIRMDTNYYYFPGSWVGDRPGFMTGSGMPMRFTDTDGSLIDVYQAATQMTDESGQSYPYTPNTLLDRALGSEGYYGAFTANLHTDAASTFEDTQVLAAAQARGVPVVTARQLLAWTDGRNGSSYSELAWSGDTLSFTVAVGAGATGLTAMLPTTGPGGRTLTAVTRGGTAVPFATMTVKGQEYAVFPAAAGAHSATYAAPTATRVTAARTAEVTDDSAVLAWSSTEPATGEVLLGTSPEALRVRSVDAGRTTRHEVEVEGLRPGTRYFYRLRSRGPDGTVRTSPAAGRPPLSFRTDAVDRSRPTVRDVRVVALPDGTAHVRWSTDEPADSRVRFAEAGRALGEQRLDDRLVRRHTVVLTGLEPRRAYRLRVESRDAAGNAARTARAVLRTPAAGFAMATAADFRTGRSSGGVRVDEGGLGSLVLRAGTGHHTSRVLDAGMKTRWRGLVLDADLPRGARVRTWVRAGAAPEPDATWSDWRPVRPGTAFDLEGRFVQYDLGLSAEQGAPARVRAVGLTRTGDLHHHAEGAPRQ